MDNRVDIIKEDSSQQTSQQTMEKSSTSEITKIEEKQSENNDDESENDNKTKGEEIHELSLPQALAETFEHILNEQQEREKVAEALLGGCMDMICTYPEGYKPRQPLYSCKTCFAETGQLAGVCYGCSENCHEGHELVELYTKRNFSCDCGNSKFVTKCKLFETKDPLNIRNRYNENFKGIFCVCKKPYPPLIQDEESGDEERNEQKVGDDEKEKQIAELLEDMIQCPVCEDWFHPSHVLSDTSELAKLDRDKDESSDLICSQCVQRLPWLVYYKQIQEEEAKKDEEGEEASQKGQQPCDGNECKLEKFKNDEEEKRRTNDDEQQQQGKITSLCLPIGWRERLCQCPKCKTVYEDADCMFLLDREDTIDFYEQQNRERMAQQENDNKVDKNQTFQREFAHRVKTGIDQMEQHCVEFFKMRAAQKRGAPMTKEDVEECFRELEAKRQKMMEETTENGEKEAAWTE